MKRLFASLLNAKPTPAGVRVSKGMRVYAIGDIHGRLDLLNGLLDQLTADDAARGPADTRLVLLGDLIDRGPDSAGVVDRVMQLIADDPNIRLIKGNHEDMLLSTVHGDRRAARGFLDVGGRQTLHSYGIGDEEIDAGGFEDLAQLIAARLPPDHLAFLDRGEDMIRFGDYAFVHAGVRPGVPLEQQSPSDLRWVRGPFLKSQLDHGAVVVHGHTPSEAVEDHFNRIGIDTGAYASGILTAVGLQDDQRWYVATTP